MEWPRYHVFSRYQCFWLSLQQIMINCNQFMHWYLENGNLFGQSTYPYPSVSVASHLHLINCGGISDEMHDFFFKFQSNAS